MGKKQSTPIYKHNGLEVKLGNFKLGDDTLIFNMGQAHRCPSLKRGYCKLGKKCYAYKDEIRYHHHVPDYRDRQEKYWKNHTGTEFYADLRHILETRKRAKKPLSKVIRYMRFNESGDFWSQKCIRKLNIIAGLLRRDYGIKVYTYSARQDLDFHGIGFKIHTSGWNDGAHGMTLACNARFLHGKKALWIDGKRFVVCPMDCRKCHVCKKTDLNVVFPLH